MITFTIDGKTIRAKAGTTILEAARAEGINIPTLCYMKGVNEIGSCKLCMVEIEGYDTLFASCRTKAAEGMNICTSSEKLTAYRKTMLRLILSNQRTDCMSCPGNGICHLQELCNRYGIKESGYAGSRAKIEHTLPRMDSNPYIAYDPSKCIHCQCCINACHNVAGNGTLVSSRTGTFHLVDAPFGENWKETGCESCGNCAAACPTGALSLKRRDSYREWEVTKVRTTCPHCATGCQLDLVVKNGRIVSAEAADGPANHGRHRWAYQRSLHMRRRSHRLGSGHRPCRKSAHEP